MKEFQAMRMVSRSATDHSAAQRKEEIQRARRHVLRTMIERADPQPTDLVATQVWTIDTEEDWQSLMYRGPKFCEWCEMQRTTGFREQVIFVLGTMRTIDTNHFGPSERAVKWVQNLHPMRPER